MCTVLLRYYVTLAVLKNFENNKKPYSAMRTSARYTHIQVPARGVRYWYGTSKKAVGVAHTVTNNTLRERREKESVKMMMVN